MPVISVRAPARIDFGGGWTDVPPCAEDLGGRVCNVAIDRYAHVWLSHTDDAIGDPGPLANAALRASGVRGVSIRMQSDLPTGAGLGGSSAACVALVTALREWQGLSLDRDAIVQESRRIEVEDAGIAGGWQDHQAATYGGALDLTYGEKGRVEFLPLGEGLTRALAERCLVFFTGESRLSASSIIAVLDAWVAGDRHVRNALRRMRDLAGEMAAAIRAADLDALGALVGEHWVQQRALHPSIPTERIDAVLAAGLAGGACGGKALGASGGGSVLLIAREGRQDDVRRAVGDLATELRCRPSAEGVTVVRHSDS